ncbi:inosose isomerase, partial [Salmonella enterica subsp. enterica serovar Typhimurium]
SPFKVLLDTFLHLQFVVAVMECASLIFISAIGLVLLSCVVDTRPTEALADVQRIMLSVKDVLQNYQQVLRLEYMGYRGIYA